MLDTSPPSVRAEGGEVDGPAVALIPIGLGVSLFWESVRPVKKQSVPNAYSEFFGRVGFLVLAFMVSVPSAHARESVKYDSSNREAQYGDGDDEDDQESAETSGDALSLIMNGHTYTSKYRTNIPTMAQARKAACYDRARGHHRSVCRVWPKVNQSFEAAGKALGFPAPALVCLMKAETNMIANRTSHVGAAGLTQFMPATARLYARLMKSSPKYRNAWDQYRREAGTNRSVAAFTPANIRSGNVAMADVQIFATAMYFRNSLRGMESYFQRSLGAPPELNSKAFRRMMHYLLVSYNAGPTRGQSFLRYGERAIPYETRQYLRKYDSCIRQAAKY